MLNAKDADKPLSSIMALGEGGAGKTANFLTLPGKKFIYIFDPNSVATLRGYDVDYQEFIPDRIDLDVVALKAGTRDKISKSGEPKTYVEFERDFEQALDHDMFSNYDWIGFDSILTLTEIIMDRVLYLNSRPGKQPEIADYVATTNTMLKIVRAVTGIGIPIYMTGHIEFKQEENTSKMQNVLYFVGKLRKRLPLSFSDILLFYGDPDREGKPRYYCRTVQDRYNPFIRTSMRNLDPVEEITIDWSRDPVGQGLGGLLKKGHARLK